MQLDGWTWEEATLRPSAGIAFQFPADQPATGLWSVPPKDKTYVDLKKERDRTLDTLADLLARARAYAPHRLRRHAPGRLGAGGAGRPLSKASCRWSSRANREADIRDAVAFGERERVRLVIEGGAEAPRVAALLKEKQVPVILGPVLQLPTRPDDHHAATYKAAALLAEAGVRFALSGGNDATNVRLLPVPGGAVGGLGLCRATARCRPSPSTRRRSSASTAEVGSLEPGKRADLFISNGDPLEARTEITHVFINGRNVGVDNMHKRLYEKHAARP